MNITAIIVDDEEKNINLLNHYILKYCPEINVISKCTTINEAKDKINELNPQILFLDIQLQNETIFDLLEDIDTSDVEIILVTAYDNFALKAFKYRVVDYILKPISIEDLINATKHAIERIKLKLNFEYESEQPKNMIGIENINHGINENLITLNSLEKIEIIDKCEIIFCKSDGRYTTFFLNKNEEKVVCKNLGEFENILIGDFFFRIHHSYIINIKHVKCIHKKNGYYCEMSNGAKLPVSKRKLETFNKFLKLYS